MDSPVHPYLSCNRSAIPRKRENVGLLLNEEGALVPEDVEKVELLNGLYS